MSGNRWRNDDFAFVRAPHTVKSIELVYETHGVLNAARDNVVVLPTYYTGRHDDYHPWIGVDRPFDPARWFIVAIDMLGNGLSTSPSTTGDSSLVELVTLADNVRAQRMLLANVFGVEHVAMVAGWSMGGMQAFEWAARFPDRVDSILAVCATARCWPLNHAFLEGLVPFLQLPPDLKRQGLGDFGRAYSSWAYSAEFYRAGLYRRTGVPTAERVRRDWADDHLDWDPRDLLTMLRAWQRTDFTEASLTAEMRLRGITAAAAVMPCVDDQYFTLAEAILDAESIPGARVSAIESPFGHMAGRPGLVPAVTEHVADVARLLLDTGR